MKNLLVYRFSDEIHYNWEDYVKCFGYEIDYLVLLWGMAVRGDCH